MQSLTNRDKKIAARIYGWQFFLQGVGKKKPMYYNNKVLISMIKI